jgi:hypothetical protein
MRSKTDQIRAVWFRGDRIGALRIAAQFFDRSVATKTFQRGIDAFATFSGGEGGPFLFADQPRMMVYVFSTKQTFISADVRQSNTRCLSFLGSFAPICPP